MNPGDAIDLLTIDGPFAFVMIDTESKTLDPSQMASDIIELAGTRPIIFVGTKVNLKDRVDQELFMQNPHFELYEVPVELESFREVVEKAMNWAKDQDFAAAIIEAEEDEFIALKLRNFFLFQELPYDAYIRLTNSKFVKALPKKQKYREADILDFSARGHKSLYLNKDEHLKFLLSSIEKVSEQLKKRNLPAKKIMPLQITALSLLHQHLQTIGVTELAQNFTTELIDSIIHTHTKLEGFLELITSYPFDQRDIAEKSVFTFYIALLLCKGIGWDSTMMLQKLGLASVLHECFLPNEKMLSIRYKEELYEGGFEEGEIARFMNHPLEASKVAANFSGIADTEFIILEHHELPDGQGLFQKKHAWRLPPISALFIVANFVATEMCLYGTKKAQLKKLLAQLENEYNIGNLKPPQKIITERIKTALKLLTETKK